MKLSEENIMPRKIIRLLAVVIGFCAVSLSQDQAPAPAIPFSQFAVHQIYKDGPKSIKFPKTWRPWRNRIWNAAARGPNFAGRYTIALWECGQSCAQAVMVDLSTGKPYRLPFETLEMPDFGREGIVFRGVDHRTDSRLLVVDGCPVPYGQKKPLECGTRYYEWDGRGYKQLRFDPHSSPSLK